MRKTIYKLIVAASILLGASSVFAESVVVVHPSNNSVFTADIISRIFLGKEKNFSNGEKITAVTSPEKGDTKQAFNEKVLNKSTSQLNSYWSKLIFTGKGRPPKALSSDDDVKQQVANDASVIGIMDAKAVDASVKVVYRF